MFIQFAEVSQLESLVSGVPDSPIPGGTYGMVDPCGMADPSGMGEPCESGDVLREYGPEFNVCALPDLGAACIDLDEHDLPHIDPRLTVRSPPAPAWEPLITKVYNDDLNRLSIINTDIY